MTEDSSCQYLVEPEYMLTPEETRAILNQAEEKRGDFQVKELCYPPKSGYSIGRLMGAALSLDNYDDLEDKIWRNYESEGVEVEEVMGGSMKTTLYSPETDTLYQHINFSIVSDFEDILAQELTALHTNQVLQQSQDVEPVTNYNLRFSFANGWPVPIRVGEYRDLDEYSDLSEEKQRNLEDEFVQAGQTVGQLMRDGEVAYAEPVEDWEQDISKNREYDRNREMVVVTDMGELSETQFAEHVRDSHSKSGEFAFEYISEAPFSSQREFLNHHGILTELEKYFKPVENKEYLEQSFKTFNELEDSVSELEEPVPDSEVSILAD